MFSPPDSLRYTAKIRCHQDTLPKMFCLMLCCSHLPPSKLATLATLCHFCFTFSLLISPQSPAGLPVVLQFCMKDIEQMCPCVFFRTKVYPKGNLDLVMFMIKYSHVCLQCCAFFLERIDLVSFRKKTRLDGYFKRPEDLVQNAAEIVNLRAIV